MRIALILTGGSGTRLTPITKTLNKGLVPIDGQPVLERIILQLETSKIDQIIVLAGHLSWQVEYLVKTRLNNLAPKILVSVTPPELSPAERLLKTSEMWVNSSEIVLVYCDNVFEDAEITHYLSDFAKQKVLVHQRTPGNIGIQGSGQVNYSVERSNQLQFVELGYWILKPVTFFNYLIEQNDLQMALQKLTTVETIYHEEVMTYRSLSDLPRYAKERAKKRNTVFLDRDGVLIKGIGKGEYVKSIGQVEFLQENIEFFSFLSSKYSVDFIVVTNQAGIERNLVTMEEVNEINKYIALKLLSAGVPILAFYFCPHHWESSCECRKPNPGMLHTAISDFILDSSRCLLIGDRESDIIAGLNANMKAFLFPETMSSGERTKSYQRVSKFLQNLNSS